MLQRPQTLFLAAAVIFLFMASFSNICTYQPDTDKVSTGLTVSYTDINFFADGEGIPEEALQGRDLQKDIVDPLNDEIDKQIEETPLKSLFQMGYYGMLSLAIITLLIIFLFKNRKLQMRIGWLLVFVLIILSGGLFYAAGAGKEILEENMQAFASQIGVEELWTVSYNMGLYLPICAALAIIVANILIKKDEKLIKSIDRIR